MTRFHKTLLSSALLTLALPANALASATVTRDGSGVVAITSTTTENNDIIAFDDGAGTLKVQELGAAVSALSADVGCSTVSSKVVSCGTTSTVNRIDANLGNGNDFFRSTTSAAASIRRRLNGEAGNDQLFGADGNDTLDGGLGDDVMDGGAGTDTVLYSGRTAADSVIGVLPDAVSGTTTGNGLVGAENDTLTSTDENLTGGAEADDFRGNDANNALVGNDGNDSLTGGTGTDTFSGGTGDDTIDSRDMVAETGVDCGAGTGDKLQADNGADNIDKAANHCEVLAPQWTSVLGAISGTSQEGQTLTAALGSYSGDAPATRDYVWFRCTGAGTGCTAIGGATARTYAPTAADVGKFIGVTELANNAAGGDSGFSDYVGPVDAKPATPAQPQTQADPQTPAATPTATQAPGPQPQQPGTKAATTPTPTSGPAAAVTVTKAGAPTTTARGGTVVADTGLVIGCPTTCRAAITATTSKRGKPTVIGKASLSLRAGKHANVTFKLSRAGAALLRRNKKLRVNVRVVTTASNGAKKTITKTLTLRAPKARKRH